MSKCPAVGALLLYNDKTMILARGDPHQMLTNANKCKRKDGSGLKRTVFRDTVFYFMVKITSVNKSIRGHIWGYRGYSFFGGFLFG